MYKITIEETIGEISKKTTVETDDVDLVKAMLQMKQDVYVHSDVDNLNIDPEWQELMQWYREHKAKEKSTTTSEEAIKELARLWEEVEKESKKKTPGTPYTFPQPYVNPFTKPFDPHSPFTVTC